MSRVSVIYDGENSLVFMFAALGGGLGAVIGFKVGGILGAMFLGALGASLGALTGAMLELGREMISETGITTHYY